MTTNKISRKDAKAQRSNRNFLFHRFSDFTCQGFTSELSQNHVEIARPIPAAPPVIKLTLSVKPKDLS
jgi:hypothetical protein